MADADQGSSRIYLSPPDTGELERTLLLDAFDSNWVAPLGPHVDLFEEEVASRVGVGHAAALSSGTAALHLALITLGVRRGDLVLSSSLTFAATANAIVYCGAEPTFVDCDETSWNMNPELLEDELRRLVALNRRPRAIIVVDLYGQCADYARIIAIAQQYDVPVIEDAAEALGATYQDRNAGQFGKAAVLSFNGNKIITTGGGGMLLSDDATLIERARYLATQARDPAPHYQHSAIGYNYRLSNLLAAVGRGQLSALDEKVAARRAVFERYVEGLGSLPGLAFMPEAEYGRSNRWLTVLTVDPALSGVTSQGLRIALEKVNIEARPVWKPMHLQPVFEGCRMVGGHVSEKLFESGLCLPSGSSLSPGDQARVIEAMRVASRIEE